MSVLHSPDRKYPLQSYLQNYDRSKFHNRDVLLSIPYSRLMKLRAALFHSLCSCHILSHESHLILFQQCHAPRFFRLLFSPKSLHFIFLLLLPALSLCPPSAATAWGWPAQAISSLLLSLQRRTAAFFWYPTFPLSQQEDEPLYIPRDPNTQRQYTSLY